MDKPLKLMGVDAEDLDVISAHIQDAVFRVGDLDYDAGGRQFVLLGNRFVWEGAAGRARRRFERRRAALVIKRVESVRTRGIDRSRGNDVLALLSIRFRAGEPPPSGTIVLVFSGDQTIELDVECIEMALSDIGGGWQTRLKPRHPV